MLVPAVVVYPMPPPERFSSVCGKAVKKPVVMGFWPHCLVFMAASPALGLKGVCPGVTIPTMVQFADTDSGLVRGIEAHLVSTARIKTCQFRVGSRRRLAAIAMLVKGGGSSSHSRGLPNGCRFCRTNSWCVSSND